MEERTQQEKVFFRNPDFDHPVIEHADGVELFDSEGNRFLDFGAGIGVVNIGYRVPEVIEAAIEQMKKTSFVYTPVFTSEAQNNLANIVIDMAPKGMAKALFVSAGSLAIECALKLARQYHCERGNESKMKVIARWTSYHGNTFGALSASGRPFWRKYFSPYLQNFPHINPPYCYRCPYGKEYPACGIACAHELEKTIKLEGAENISAFIAEPVTGTSAAGVTPPPEYYPIIREICDRHDVLFISDEVITGFGRTGKNFGINHWNVLPDIIVAGKGVAGGYSPLATVIVSTGVHDVFRRGSNRHTQGFTYSGNPLSCAIGCAVLNYLRDNNLVERAGKIGGYVKNKLEELKEIPIVGDVRGKGLLLGVEFVQDRAAKTPFPAEIGLTSRIVAAAFRRRMHVVGGMGGMIDGVLGDHLQITPSFTITEQEVDEAVGILKESILEVMKELE